MIEKIKEYTIQIGEVFTEQKALELKEYLELKDKDIVRARTDAFKEVLEEILNKLKK